MDRKYIEENEIEIKYLRNQLTPDQLEEFEVYLMENPEALESMELHQGLIHGVENLENVSHESNISKLFSVFKPKFIGAYGLGAASMMAIMISFNAVQLSDNTSPSFSKVVYLSPTRGVETDAENTINIEFSAKSYESNSTDQIVLILDTGVLSQAEYYFRLKNAKENISIGPEFVASDNDGQVVISVDLHEVRAGLYRLELVSPAEDFRLEYQLRLL